MKMIDNISTMDNISGVVMIPVNSSCDSSVVGSVEDIVWVSAGWSVGRASLVSSTYTQVEQL